MNTLLSVVVPVYNTEAYLKECIDSILSQTYSNIELILVDDGSNDNSVEICEEYVKIDSRVNLIKQSHEGMFRARRKGVLSAKGDYVTFVDSDDFIAPISYQLASDDMDFNVDVIMYGITRHFENRNAVEFCRYKPGIYNKCDIVDNIFPNMIWDDDLNGYGLDPSLCSKIFKKDIIYNFYIVNSEMNSNYGEDQAVLFPIVLNSEKIVIHRESYYYHRQRESNILAPYFVDDNFLLKLYDFYVHLLKYFGNNKMFRRQVDLLYAHCVRYNGLKYGLSMYVPNDVFPFDKVEKGENIIIYGAGDVGKLYMKQLSKLNYCNVVLWVDINKWKDDSKISHPDNIINVNYDKIVISILDANIRKCVRQYLLDFGISEERII